jgi:hypothetical protein
MTVFLAQTEDICGLEHVAAKLYDFADNNMLQNISLARILSLG